MCWRSILKLKRIFLKVTSFPTAIMWENSTMTAQTTERCELIEASLQFTSSVCSSLLNITLGNLRTGVWEVHSALVLGLFPHTNYTDFMKQAHSKKRNFHDNILQQLNSYLEPFLILVLKIKKVSLDCKGLTTIIIGPRYIVRNTWIDHRELSPSAMTSVLCSYS